MTWEEIKQLPDREFLQAISRKEFSYNMFKSYKILNEFGSFFLYQSNEFDPENWTIVSQLYIRESGIYLDTWFAWIKVRKKIERDLIQLADEEKGDLQ